MFLDDDNNSIQAAELTKRSLVDTQARMGMMLDVMPMGLLIHTMQGIIYANQEAMRLLKVSNAEIIGRHFLDFLQTKAVEANAQMAGAFNGQLDLKTTEVEIKANDGVVRTIKLIAGALPWDGTPVVELLLQDVTDLKEVQETLRRLAVTDELTGAFNRRYAFGRARELFAGGDEHWRLLTVAVLDIDYFKRVNDTYGHASGDAALRTLSETVKALGGDDFTFARIGGEEFMVLFPRMDVEVAKAFCEHIRHHVESTPVASPAGVFNITVSIGIAARGPADKSFDDIFSRADKALYRAKEDGRNRVDVEPSSAACGKERMMSPK